MIIRLLKVTHMFELGILGEGRLKKVLVDKFQHTVCDVLKVFKQALVVLNTHS